jgi:hypothetical protein
MLAMFNNFVKSYNTNLEFKYGAEMVGTVFLVIAYLIIAKALGIQI